MRKLYPDGTYGYMQWIVQGSYIESPDWTNTTAYPYKLTNGQIHQCIPDVTASYDVTACSSAGQTSTLTITNNESQTIYFKVNPSKTASTYSTSVSNTYNYNTTDATTFSVAANTTFVYTAGAVTYGVNEDAYMFWRIQKSYTENPTWNTESYPYQYLSSPTSGLSYQHDCDLNVDPYNNGNHQYETRPSNEQNSCVDNKQWMGWVLRNANSTDPNRTSLWYAFEVSIDNGANFNTNNLFYRMDDVYYDNDVFAVTSGSGSLSADGYTAVQATNNLNMSNSSSNQYIYLSTRAVSGSIMKIRYKVAYAENELGSTDWITLGTYSKTIEQRTTDCEPEINTSGWGTATTTDTTNDTFSDIVTIGECQNTIETGGFATSTLTLTRPSGVQYYLKLWQSTDSGSNWTPVETNFAMGTTYTKELTVNHAGKIKYKFQFSYISGDFSNSNTYYSAEKTVNCPTVGASTASIALGTCVSGGATPTITLGNNGWATGYFHVQYSTDLGQNYNDAFYDPNNGNATIYQMILPGEVKTYTIQDTISQGTTVVMQYRFAATSPVSSGSFTTTGTLLIDCSSDVSTVTVEQDTSAEACYNGSQRLKVRYTNSSSSNNYFYYKINKNSQGYDTNWSVATLNANTSNGTVTLPESYGNNDTVLVKYHIESTEGGSYGTEVINNLITIDCGTDDFFTVSTDYVSCNLYGADKLEFKFKRNSTSASFSSNAYLHIEAEISHDGNIWKPLGRMQYSNESTGYWYSSSGTKGNLNDTHPTYHGYIRPYYFSNNEYVAGVILTDSTHQYQIRYRTYTSTTNNLTMGNFTGVFTTITIAPDTNCDQNDIQPVTLTTTQLTCLENKGQVEFTFNDTTVTHLDPYQPARLFYQYSTNGGVTWSTNINQREALSNTATFNLPSVKVTNGTALQIKWGYVRDHTLYSTSTSYHTYHNTYSNSNINARQFDYIGGLTSTGLYYEHYREDDSSNDFNANFMNHNMVNTTTVNVDCDPDSTYSQTLTTCECNDLGATSTLSITNNDNYTSYYKVQYKIGNGQWLSATDSLESAFDISVSGGTTNDSLSKFVPDGETIQWRVKDTTNGGDFDGQEWEEVTASATVDCGCAGGSVDIDITSSTCGNGSSTPIINLIPSSSDTAYFTVQYKRNTDTDWVAFKTEESVTNGQTENHTMQVTVVHQGTIQVRYKVNKILGNLSSQEWNYTDTKTINCPFTAVLGEAIYSSCGTNYRAASFKVTNTSSSTSAAQFRVQYKIVTSSTTVTDWTNSSIIDSVVAPGASLVTTNNLQITEGQKIIWRYESVNSSEDFLNNWTEDDTSGYVNCVINVTVTNAMSSCDAGSQTATLNLTNDESDNTVYFQVHYKTGNSWILKSANLAVSPGDTNRTLTVDVEHTKNIQWKYKVSDTSNDYGNSEEVELAASATVNCPILDATGSSAFGACESGQRKSTFTMINSASANAPAYFYVQYDLSGDNQSWINATQANLVTAGGQNNVHVFVPNGETITWRYYPMTTATTPADNQWIAETTKTPEDCSLDTLISHTLDACISNSQVSRFVLTNNTAGNVYYQVEYFIEGTSAYVVADNDLLLSAGSPQAFTQTVDSGKYIQWRYKAATSQNGLLSAAYVDHVENTEFKKSVNCESIDPSVIQSFGICYNDTKEVKFIIKNSSSATTTAFFKVQYKIGSGEWIDKPDQTIGIGGQYPHSQIVASGQTIQWQYKVAKNQAALPTGWTTLNETTIACSGGEDISVTFDTNCDANGYKTSKLNIFNSSSGTLYYKAEYTFEGASSNNWTVAAEQVVIATGNSTFLPISVQQGQAITWRYKVSETGNDFGSLNWTTSQTSDVVDCTGVSISTPYTSLSQCVSGAKTSTFNYTTLSSSANAAYFHIQYRIDGGTWINKVTSSDGTLAAGQSNAVTQSVTSGTTIEWQYKAAYSSTALTNASFISVAGGAEEVDCGVQLSVSHSFSTCANQTATSTLLLKNTGATPMLVTVQSKLNTGSWATEVSTYEITASNELSLTKTIVSGQTISWKYKYAGTVVKLSSASETTMDTIPALDCETAVLSQVSVNNVLKSCVLGKRISELTFTNNSTETVYVEAWYDTGSGYVLKGTYSVINGTPRVLESPGADHQASVKWKYRLGLSSSVTGNFTELSALTVDCPQTSQVSATLEACTNLTRDSKLNIKNTGSVTQYYQIYYSISNGSYQYLTEISLGAGLENNSSYVNLSSGQYINWKYKTSTVQGDFANSNDNFVTRSATVNCIDDSLSATTSSTCTPNGAISTKTSKFTITNSSADSKQVEVQYSTDNANYLPMGTHTVTNLQPYVDDRIFTTNYFTYRYRILGTTNWSPTVISMAPSDCSTPTNVISAYNTNQCESGSSIAKLTIVNPGQAATVIYDININNEGWQSGGNALVNGTFTSSGVKVPANTSFQWRYKLVSDTTYKFVNDIANNCSPGSSISAITEILCPQDGDGSEKSARLRIINVGSQSVSVMYNYKINNGSTVSGSAPVPINPNSSGYSIQVPLNDGDQIVFGYKLTSDTSYQQTPSKSTSECGTGLLNPELIQTISECTQNFAVSTIEMRNLSDQVKTFYLEYRINNGPWVSHDIVTVNASSPATSTLNVTQNSTVQWRALENSYTQFDLNSPYQLSQVETVICESTTTTTLPPVKYIFEPIVSTNRVCDFEDGGAEFGITVDNSRSNVSAKVLKKIWINTTLIAQETVNVPAGQSVDFSSIEVGENKFFTVALEVTNNENGKVQKMIKNKDADCIEDERPINEGLNPSDEIQASEDIDNVMDGDGDDQEMEDNGESLLFLPGDDFVEFVYNEDADNPFVPQFTDESPPTPGIPFTGRNVGGFIISFGLLLMGLGAFILRRAY